ncbi:pinopsin-like isoform X2 [Varanus komodoensis]|nr:pinopsin-like isoform X2 [Varanus komodoensis]
MSLCGTTIVIATNYHGYFFLGQRFCTFQGFAVNYFGIVSLWSLTILAYERYNVVCQPLGTLQMSIKRGYQLLGFIWIFCLFWAVVPLFGWSSYGPEGVQTSCSIGWEERSWNNYSYLIVYFLCCFLIPVLIIGFSYGNVIRSLHGLNQKIEQMGGKSSAEEEFRAVVMVLVMVVAFLICWLPYTVFALIVVFNPALHISPLAATIPTYLSKTSPVYNPIIYIFLNKQFRECAVEFITCGQVILTKPEEEISTSAVPAECQTPWEQDLTSNLQICWRATPVIPSEPFLYFLRSVRAAVQGIWRMPDWGKLVQCKRRNSRKSKCLVNSPQYSVESQTETCMGFAWQTYQYIYHRYFMLCLNKKDLHNKT